MKRHKKIIKSQKQNALNHGVNLSDLWHVKKEKETLIGLDAWNILLQSNTNMMI